MNIENKIEHILGKQISKARNNELYNACLTLCKEMANDLPKNHGDRKLYYISAEFLIGKLLSNNLINLGIYDEISTVLAKHGKNLTEIEEIENEPSLGNGGLGRLAACFLDSIASLGLNGDGIGLNYHYGLFKQVFKNNLQTETKNPWITDNSWLTDTNRKYKVNFGNFSVDGHLYDIDVIGYKQGVNKLHLFDIDTLNEKLVKRGINFDKENIKENLTLFLYPDDSDEAGHLLRIYQQYFMVSCGAQYIIEEYLKDYNDLNELDKHIVIQINDTHPTLVIPELIYRLTNAGIKMDRAIEIVTNTCAYTNHTILSEALEKWPTKYLQEVVPHLMPIIEHLNDVVNDKYDNEEVSIIDDQNRVHMARIDMHFGYSINGVAYLHTEILKNSELKAFYEIYPEKFNNKTNGITFRRWLMHTNPILSNYITLLIGDGWKTDATCLEDLLKFENDETVLNTLLDIKHQKKVDLKNYILKNEGVEIDENSIFSIQIKRLHEYKRQQMNALYIIYKYLQIKKGFKPQQPLTMIFGAKAAPAYTIAKDIIHLLLNLQQLINNDPEVSPYLKVVMVENYNVTYAEKLIPAADISEQISLASKEASGTGNMKFMLNGAITLGTMDGANVEISELVEEDNIYLFGESSDTVIKLYETGKYSSRQLYNSDSLIKEAVDFIISDELKALGSQENLERLYNEILNKDWFMTLLDLNDYIYIKDKMINDYQNKEKWKKMMLVNIAKAGFFSSDRTIAQYNQDIWKL